MAFPAWIVMMSPACAGTHEGAATNARAGGSSPSTGPTAGQGSRWSDEIGPEGEGIAIARALGPASEVDARMQTSTGAVAATAGCETRLRRDPGIVLGSKDPVGHYVAIVAGERICVEFESKGSALVPSKIVPATEHPDRTVQISADIKDGATILTVVSPFSRSVRYHAVAVLDGRNHRMPTCAISPARSAYETWPEPFDGLILHNFVQLSTGDAAACGR